MRQVRTRFAPSPTGYMHIGNLRTALFEYLVAKANHGVFILRLEDTDRERLVDGSIEVIYNTMKLTGMHHDEGPDVGGPYAPYVQSERRNIYRPEAEKLVSLDKAYYCFCTEERLAELKQTMTDQGMHFTYDRHCRNLDPEFIKSELAKGTPYVIRQKMPLEGTTTFSDEVYGDISVENKELEDQILLKSDGYPTYNFANVVDDHAMDITHVVRGSEYLSSTPKYNLLYEAFGYQIPSYIHLPLILGSDGHKLSKRHGATSFQDLVNEGYLPEAIINYIALLGWSPGGTEEVFSLSELEQIFSVKGISKSPAVFDYDKLAWFNSVYIQKLPLEELTTLCEPYFVKVAPNIKDHTLLARILQPRLKTLNEIETMIAFLNQMPDYDPEIFVHKKMKTTLESSLTVLEELLPELENLVNFDETTIHNFLIDSATKRECKNGFIMWPIRIAVTGQAVTPGGATEILSLLGKDEALSRLKLSIAKLKKVVK